MNSTHMKRRKYLLVIYLTHYKSVAFLGVCWVVMNGIDVLQEVQQTQVYKHKSHHLHAVSEVFSNYYFQDISSIQNYEMHSKTNKNLFLPLENVNYMYSRFGTKYTVCCSKKMEQKISLEIKNSISLHIFRKKYKDLLLKQ